MMGTLFCDDKAEGLDQARVFFMAIDERLS